jgi:ubiquinol-cytochrome c reductase cytochrome c subunit
MTSDNPAERRADRRGGLRARLGRAGAGGRRAGGPPSRARRRLGSVVRIAAALALAGGVYAAFAPGLATAQDTPQLSGAGQEGKALFDTGCITCHGRNAQGVEGRGPSLIGVGAASVEFQVTSGPLTPQGDDEEQAEALARGGELYRLNCASCHTFGGGGGALSSGKWAPSVSPATERQVYAAMLSGPQNMPVFGDNQLTPEEKRQVVAYVQTLQQDKEPGGWHLGRLGPVTEGVAIFLVGITALVFTTLWIAGKS